MMNSFGKKFIVKKKKFIVKKKKFIIKKKKFIIKNQNLINKTYEYMDSVGFSLYPHQKDGIRWMLNKELNGFLLQNNIKSGLLCDIPGLGKTIQTCATIWANPVSKTLLIVPKSVIDQWVGSINKIIPNCNIHIHHGTSKFKSIDELYQSNFNIVITTLQSIYKKREQTIFHHFGLWDRIIIDEAHYIRNTKSISSIMACSLRAKHKWCLTGTPIQNNIKDLLALYKFIGVNECYLNKSYIEKLNKSLLLRRNKCVLNKSNLKIPKIIYNEHIVNFKTKKERDFYIDIKKNILDEYIEIMNSGLSINQQNLVIFELLLRLRQVTIHPQIVINGLEKKFGSKFKNHYNGSSSKIDKIVDMIKHTGNDLCIVFCQFKNEIDILQKTLEKFNIGSKRYDGSMNLKQRKKTLDSFMPSENNNLLKNIVKKLPFEIENIIHSFTTSKVLLMQIKAGGVGLNLQQFQHIFITSPDWNPGNEIQAIARADRIGQNKVVNIHKFILKDQYEEFKTIDEYIFNTQVKKLDTINNIFDNEENVCFNLSRIRINIKDILLECVCN